MKHVYTLHKYYQNESLDRLIFIRSDYFSSYKKAKESLENTFEITESDVLDYKKTEYNYNNTFSEYYVFYSNTIENTKELRKYIIEKNEIY